MDASFFRCGTRGGGWGGGSLVVMVDIAACNNPPPNHTHETFSASREVI